MMKWSRLFVYTVRIFGKRFLGVTAALALLCFVLEFFMLKKTFLQGSTEDPLFFLSLKIPFIVDKVLPLIIMISGYLTVSYLKRSQEWVILQSAGASLFKILKGPLLMCAVIAGGDLLFWSPWAQDLMDQAMAIQKKVRSSEVVQIGDAWRVDYDKSGILFFHRPRTEKEGHFVKVLRLHPDYQLDFLASSRSCSFTEEKIGLQEVWMTRPGKPPQFYPKLTIKKPVHFLKSSLSKHPLFMSFLETQHKSGNKILDKTVALRWSYLLSNAVWLIVLWPFSCACVAGYVRGRTRLYEAASGLVLCFFMYVFKEWTYFSIHQALYGVGHVLLWAVPVMTVVITMWIFLEKLEI